jgi:anti-sigma regulatory factor (Ser/Thr protein kinase)
MAGDARRWVQRFPATYQSLRVARQAAAEFARPVLPAQRCFELSLLVHELAAATVAESDPLVRNAYTLELQEDPDRQALRVEIEASRHVDYGEILRFLELLADDWGSDGGLAWFEYRIGPAVGAADGTSLEARS